MLAFFQDFPLTDQTKASEPVDVVCTGQIPLRQKDWRYLTQNESEGMQFRDRKREHSRRESEELRGTSLVIQWLRIHLSMPDTWVWPLVWKDSTWCRATKPIHHNHWSPNPNARALQERSYRSKKPAHYS